MIYVLIYWIVGVVVNLLLTLLVERTEKHTWVSFLMYWIVFPFIFPLTLFALKDDISSAFKRIEKKPMETEPSIPLKKQEATETKDDDAFEMEWQAFIKDTMPDKEVTLIERKIVVDNYRVSKDYEKMVMYLEDDRNKMVNAFIEKHYNVLCKIFQQWGYTFIYAPKEAEKIAKHYSTPVPVVEWNAATVLDMLHCPLDEPIGTAMVVIGDVEWEDDRDCWMATMRGLLLDVETEAELTAQIRGYWKILNEEYKAQKEEESRFRYRMVEKDDDDNIRYRMSDDDDDDDNIRYRMETRYYSNEDECGYESRREEEESCCMSGGLFADDGESAECRRNESFRKRKEYRNDSVSQRRRSVFSNILEELYHLNEELTEEDEQLLSEIKIRVEKLRQRGIRQHLIEQIVMMTVPTSHLEVTPDARILLTDYGKEVQMLPIDKVVYILYLRHPEGISIKNLADHKEELMGLYARVLGKAELTDKQKASVERLCDPWDNSINEKLSRIRKSFCAEVHESVANSYVVQGSRGEDRYIPLDEELIELGDWGR